MPGRRRGSPSSLSSTAVTTELMGWAELEMDLADRVMELETDLADRVEVQEAELEVGQAVAEGTAEAGPRARPVMKITGREHRRTPTVASGAPTRD